MNARRSGRKARAALLAAFAVTVGLAACAPASAENEIVFWTALAGDIDIEGQEQVIEAFEEANPGMTVRLVRKPGQFTGDASSLITAVRSGNTPDVILVDRFTVGQLAAIGLLTNLDPLIEQEGGQEFLDNYLSFGIDEGSFDGSVYSLPTDGDARGLFYNKELFREAGVDMEFLDPENGPPTIDDVMAAAEQLTKTNENGDYTQLGFHPWDGQAFHATWGLARGAQFFDNETCEVTPREPAFMRAFEFFDEWSDRLGYDRVDAFRATYQPPEAPPDQTMFLTGHLAMAIDGNWYLSNLRDYAPDLEYGITYLPVENEGDEPFTWSGGFALTVPTGAADPEKSWEFLKFMTGEEGQRIWVTQTNRIPVWESLLDDEDVTGQQGIFPSMMDFVRIRPPLPVGAQFSDAMSAAQDGVVLGDLTPGEALDMVYDRVQPQVEQYCPFTIEQTE